MNKNAFKGGGEVETPSTPLLIRLCSTINQAIAIKGAPVSL